MFNVNNVLFVPEHTVVAAPDIVPPTALWFTYTVPTLLSAVPQLPPLVMTARYLVVLEIPVNAIEVAVLEISIHWVPPSTDLCHLFTVPVFDVSCKVPELLPPQKLRSDTEPPTGGVPVFLVAVARIE